MNNSKKLRTKKVKEVKLSEKPITTISKPWLITSIVLVVLLIGGLLFDQIYEPTLMSIDGKKYHLSDVGYYFYGVEYGYDYYDQMFGGGYWDYVTDEDTGETMRDVAKQDAIDQTLQYEILYNEAVSQGYELTSDEKNTISDNVTSLLSGQLSASVIDKNDFTKSYLTKILSKETLADRYRTDTIDTLDVDDDAIKEGINYDDYRQYDIETIYISTQTTDEDGNTVDVSADEKSAAYDKLSSIYDSAKESDDWSTLLGDDEEDLKYKTDSFIETDSTYSDDFEKMMMAMDNGAISDIYEDTTGYYIVRMVNNNSSESYDNAVDQAITDAENQAFDDYYTSTVEPKHTYTLNDKNLDKLTMGSITLG